MTDDGRGGGDSHPKGPATTTITINQVLMVVYDLPYLVLPEWYLPLEKEKEVLDSMQRNYRAEVQWLDGYFAGRNPDISDPALHLGYGAAVLTRRLHDICFELVARGATGGVTAGYTVEAVKKSDGKIYQENRVYNHFSVVPEGRAGESVRLHYDSSETDLNVGSNNVNALHAAAILRHQKPLRLSKEFRQRVPGVKRLPHETGPFSHLRKQG